MKKSYCQFLVNGLLVSCVYSPDIDSMAPDVFIDFFERAFRSRYGKDVKVEYLRSITSYIFDCCPLRFYMDF